MLKKSTSRHLMIFLRTAADPWTGLAGAALTITLSKAGGAFATITPTTVDRGSGWYDLLILPAHVNLVGDWCLHITAAAAKPTDYRDVVSEYLVDDLQGNGLDTDERNHLMALREDALTVSAFLSLGGGAK